MRSRALTLCLLCCVFACGEPARPQVDVMLTGLPGGVVALVAEAWLDGVPSRRSPARFTQEMNRFVIALPAGGRGTLRLEVEGVGLDECRMARGRAVLPIGDDQPYEAQIAMAELKPYECNPVVVERLGAGGRIVSIPAGIDCGEVCSHDFAPGENRVQLIPMNDDRGRFNGWSGACGGMGTCFVTPEPPRTKIRVRAAFGANDCSTSGWCPDDPLPRGEYSFAGIWGSGPDNVLVVGDRKRFDASGNEITPVDGVILRWDGTGWADEKVALNHIYPSQIWGSGPHDIFVPTGDRLLHYDGERWATLLTAAKDDGIGHVWGSGPRDVYVVVRHMHTKADPSGLGVIVTFTYDLLHWDGRHWETRLHTDDAEPGLGAIWGSGPDHVFVLGGPGTIWHWNGDTWTMMDSGTMDPLSEISGTNDGRVLATGCKFSADPRQCTAVRWEAGQWRPESNFPQGNYLGALGTDGADLFALGSVFAKRPPLPLMFRWDRDRWVNQDLSTFPDTTLGSFWGQPHLDQIVLGSSRILRRSGDGGSWHSMRTVQRANYCRLSGAGTTFHALVGCGDFDSHIAYRDGSQWVTSANSSGSSGSFEDIWFGDDRHAFAVGYHQLQQWDGSSWTLKSTDWELRRISGANLDHVVAVGGKSTDRLVLHYDGGAWTKLAAPPCTPDTVLAMGQDQIYLFGDNQGRPTLVKWEAGTMTWKPMMVEGFNIDEVNINAFYGTDPGNIWAVGDGGVVLRYDGALWRQVPSRAIEDLHAIWGASKTDILAVGKVGTILHWDGSAWSPQTSGTKKNLNAVWGNSAGTVFVMGDSGTVLQHR